MSGTPHASGGRWSVPSWLPGAVVTVVLAVAAGACGSPPRAEAAFPDGTRAEGAASRSLAVGDVVPPLAVRRIGRDGREDADSLRIDRIGPEQHATLVAVWATWCAACREEFAELERLHRTLGPRGLRVVAVSVDEGSSERVARFVAGRHATFDVGHDASGAVAERLRLVGVPETFLLDRDGRIRWRQRGTLTSASRPAIEAILRLR